MPVDIYKELGDTVDKRVIAYTIEDFVSALEDIYKDEDIVTIVRAIDEVGNKIADDFFDSSINEFIYEVFREIGRNEAQQLGIQENNDE